ncbi:PREDICTED: uncharacterized protein LOC109236839 [Nicotiana attenuata]|uniref:uncharacterized protein LOC109218290 n=1 Tax=Nicotiana attenuata TaxID=49451 RepID=UPI000905D4DE|nr:PREDICTED: uncharacterized protein LOC109218290 [Nicotiana attenuata]XP_019258616.1 PREDICTED: uncharacterized protein LOC109236839 [Nicotiana attenuata]
MIIGGADDPQCAVSKQTKTSATEGSAQQLLPEETLIFTEKDLEAMGEPHNDALVTSFLLNNTRIKRVLVDPSSSANIIRSGVIEQLGLLSQINTVPRILHSFNMIEEETKGEITLPINTSGMTQSTKFQVIDGDMRYNALLGRPWIHDMRAAPSTLH